MRSVVQALVAGCFGVAAVVIASPAHASGFDAPNVGSQQSGPVTRDAASVYYNPGQLGYLDRAELSFGAGVIIGKVGYERDRRGAYQFADNLDFAEPIDPADIDPSRTGVAPGVSSTPAGPIVDVFFAIPAIPERLSFGAGIYVPYAAILDLPRDGAQRFSAQSVTLLSANATFAAGVKLHDVISIGAGVSYVLTFMELSKVQDFGAVDTFADGLTGEPINQANDFGAQAPSTVRELDVLARQIDITKGLSHGVTFNVGGALRPTKALDLAFGYQHGSRVRLHGDFVLDMNDEFFTQDLAAQGLQYPPRVQGDATIELSLPKRLTAGAGYRFNDKFSLEAMASYVLYQDFDNILINLHSPDLAQPTLGIGESVDQDLVRDWKGTGHVEFTGRIRPLAKLEVSALLGYQSSASPDSTVDMASPDGNRIIFGAGVGWTFTERFSLYGDFEGQAIVPRRVTDSDFDLGNGRYNLFLGALSVHGRVRFGPRARKTAQSRPAETPEAEADGQTDPSGEDPARGDPTVEPVPEAASEPAGSSETPSRSPPPPPPPPPPPR
jgi:long-chain fatty acid transport protein